MNGTQSIARQAPPIVPNILVMEDEVNVANGLKMVLTEEGYTVDLAMTGKDALECFERKIFDLLVADLRLPDINGLDVIRRVKSKRPETNVVVITGYASVDSAVDAMKLGTYDYLPKPFTENEIITAVEGALKGRRSMPEDAIVRNVARKEADMLIDKEEVLNVLDRTAEDELFWRALMEQGSEVLGSYRLSSQAKAAIVSGDLAWILRHVGPLTSRQAAFIHKRLEREAW